MGSNSIRTSEKGVCFAQEFLFDCLLSYVQWIGRLFRKRLQWNGKFEKWMMLANKGYLRKCSLMDDQCSLVDIHPFCF